MMDSDSDKKLNFFNKKKYGVELDQQDLKVLSGNGENETDKDLAEKIVLGQIEEASLIQLGLHMNQESIKFPICGRFKGKWGRISLKELREDDGKSREQQKID